MTQREKVDIAQAVLVLGSDDDTCSVFLDPVWLNNGESGAEAVEQVLKHRSAYTGGGLILTAAELRELADSLDHDTPENSEISLAGHGSGLQRSALRGLLSGTGGGV